MRFWRLFLPVLQLFFVTSCQSLEIPAPKGKMSDSEWTKLRKEMVLQQIKERNVTDPRVIETMEKVARHLFIPEANRSAAYEDKPISIGFGQTISQPYIVALMTEVLHLKKGEKVLEVGTGSGYQAAVLAEMGAETYTIEIIPELAALGQKNLEQTGYKNVKVKVGDAYLGWKEHAPFDAILVTCAPEDVPSPLAEQLKEGGRMIIPIGPEGQIQDLVFLKKVQGKLEKKSVAPVRFVPMMRESQNINVPK